MRILLIIILSSAFALRKRNFDGFSFSLCPNNNITLECPFDRGIKIYNVTARNFEDDECFRDDQYRKGINISCSNWNNIFKCTGLSKCVVYLERCLFPHFKGIQGNYSCDITTSSRSPITTLSFCLERSYRGILWPSIGRRRTQYALCPWAKGQVATWKCSDEDSPQWIGSPNFTNCSSYTYNSLYNQTTSLDHSSVERFTKELEGASSTQVVSGEAVDQFISIIKLSVERSENVAGTQSLILANSLVSSANNILDADKTSEAWKDIHNVHATANKLFIAFESATSLFIRSNDQTYNNQKKNIHVTSKSINNLTNLHAIEIGNNDEAKFQIPIDNYNIENGGVSATLVLFKNVGAYLACTTGESCPQVINSPVASFSIQNNEDILLTNRNLDQVSSTIGNSETWKNMKDRGQQLAARLKENVLFTLAHSQNLSHLIADCVFWDFNLLSQMGTWSSKGCRVVSTNLTHTRCSCNHLTSFAILMSPTAPKISYYNDLILTIISYIGCIVSIICLLLSFIAFNICKSLESDRNSIHKNLAINLLIANLIFIVGIDVTQNQVLCSVVAGVLDYFLLVSFAWMLSEGVQLYFMLIHIFESEKSRMRYFYPLAYGVPVLIVAISAAVYHDGFGTENYCWLTTERGFIWAFLAPVLLTILVNFIMLGVAVKAMHKHFKSSAALQRKDITNLQHLRFLLRGAVVLVFLLGSTWIFGIFYFSGYTIFFAYLFTIINSFQGLFIFIFHCVLNDKIQKDIRRMLVKCTCLPKSWRSKIDVSTTVSSSKINSSSDKVKLKKVKNKSTTDSGVASEDAAEEQAPINASTKVTATYVP